MTDVAGSHKGSDYPQAGTACPAGDTTKPLAVHEQTARQSAIDSSLGVREDFVTFEDLHFQLPNLSPCDMSELRGANRGPHNQS